MTTGRLLSWAFLGWNDEFLVRVKVRDTNYYWCALRTMSRWLAKMVKAKPSKQSAVLGEGLLDALVQASFVTMAVLNKIGAENDLSLTQLRVCGILRDRRPRMAALAAYLGLEKSTMSGLVDRAEKRGLLARAPNPDDGRAVDVYLTVAGARLAERLEDQV